MADDRLRELENEWLRTNDDEAGWDYVRALMSTHDVLLRVVKHVVRADLREAGITKALSKITPRDVLNWLEEKPYRTTSGTVPVTIDCAPVTTGGAPATLIVAGGTHADDYFDGQQGALLGIPGPGGPTYPIAPYAAAQHYAQGPLSLHQILLLEENRGMNHEWLATPCARCDHPRGIHTPGNEPARGRCHQHGCDCPGFVAPTTEETNP